MLFLGAFTGTVQNGKCKQSLTAMFFCGNIVWLANVNKTNGREKEAKRNRNWRRGRYGKRKCNVFEKKGKFLQVNRAQRFFRALQCFVILKQRSIDRMFAMFTQRNRTVMSRSPHEFDLEWPQATTSVHRWPRVTTSDHEMT